jgi:hypothetical protein
LFVCVFLLQGIHLIFITVLWGKHCSHLMIQIRKQGPKAWLKWKNPCLTSPKPWVQTLVPTKEQEFLTNKEAVAWEDERLLRITKLRKELYLWFYQSHPLSRLQVILRQSMCPAGSWLYP